MHLVRFERLLIGVVTAYGVAAMGCGGKEFPESVRKGAWYRFDAPAGGVVEHSLVFRERTLEVDGHEFALQKIKGTGDTGRPYDFTAESCHGAFAFVGMASAPDLQFIDASDDCKSLVGKWGAQADREALKAAAEAKAHGAAASTLKAATTLVELRSQIDDVVKNIDSAPNKDAVYNAGTRLLAASKLAMPVTVGAAEAAYFGDPTPLSLAECKMTSSTIGGWAVVDCYFSVAVKKLPGKEKVVAVCLDPQGTRVTEEHAVTSSWRNPLEGARVGDKVRIGIATNDILRKCWMGGGTALQIRMAGPEQDTSIKSSADCRKTDDCKNDGQCTFVKDQGCVVKSDADCAQSKVCREDKRCTRVGESCAKVMRVQLCTIQSDFTSNEVSAEKKYADTKLLVGCSVARVRKGPLGGIHVQCACGGVSDPEMDIEGDGAERLQVGQSASAACQIGQFVMGQISVTDCKIQ